MASTMATDSSSSSSYAISRAVGQIEAFCGVVVSGMMTLFILLVAVYAVLAPQIDESADRLKLNHYWLVAIAATVVLVAEVFSTNLILRTVQRTRGKKLLALAERHPKFPIPLRPIVFLWWTVHFGLVALAGHYLTPMIRIVEDPTQYQRWATSFIRFLFALGVSFSSNSYLMLMTASLTRRPGVIRAVFRLRIVADVLLCADLLLPRQWF